MRTPVGGLKKRFLQSFDNQRCILKCFVIHNWEVYKGTYRSRLWEIIR